MGRPKTIWSKSCNAQVGTCFTFVMQLKIGIEPAYQVWLFDKFNNYCNLCETHVKHMWLYILLWHGYRYETDQNALDIKSWVYHAIAQ